MHRCRVLTSLSFQSDRVERSQLLQPGSAAGDVAVHEISICPFLRRDPVVSLASMVCNVLPNKQSPPLSCLLSSILQRVDSIGTESLQRRHNANPPPPDLGPLDRFRTDGKVEHLLVLAVGLWMSSCFPARPLLHSVCVCF